MKQHELKAPAGARKSKKRLGIGDSFAGRGVKGQLKRVGKGKALRAGFEGGQIPLLRRMPKLGGFKNINRISYQTVNLRQLEALDGDVNAEVLKKAGLIRSKLEPVKILAVGELTKKLNLTVNAASEKAKAAIEKAGGSLTIVDPRSKARQAGDAKCGQKKARLAAEAK